MKKEKQNNKGFTLVEVMVVLVIILVVGTMIMGVFFAVARNANKAKSLDVVKKNGNYAIEQMSRSIRYAGLFDGISIDGVTYQKNCIVPIASNPSQSQSRSIASSQTSPGFLSSLINLIPNINEVKQNASSFTSKLLAGIFSNSPSETTRSAPRREVAGTATLNLSVTGSADDAYERTDGASASSTDNSLMFYTMGTDLNFDSGIRFNNVTIPQGATITNSVLKLWFNSNTLYDDINIDIYAEDVDTAQDFVTNTDINGRTRTSHTISWINDYSGNTNAYTSSSDIAIVIQEVVNRPGWVSGNSIVILGIAKSYSGQTKYALASTYDESVGKEPKLDITYELSADISPWIGIDLPNTVPVGDHGKISNGNYDLFGGGVGFWYEKLQGRFAYQTLSVNDDFEITGLINNFYRQGGSTISQWSRAGFVVLQDIVATSNTPYAFSGTTPSSNGAFFEYRVSGTDTQLSGSRTNISEIPVWLKLKKVGNDYTAFKSATGLSPWTQLGTSQTIPMTGNIYVGFVSSAEDFFASSIDIAEFRNVTLDISLPVTCSPASQSVYVGAEASLWASNGNGIYSWSAPGGTPANGTGTNFDSRYSVVNSNQVTVSSAGRNAVCTVDVIAVPPATQYKYVKVTDSSGEQFTYSCISSEDVIADPSLNEGVKSKDSLGAETELVDTSSVQVDTCSITCRQDSLASPPTVTINFELSSKTSSTLPENKTSIPFQTSVTTRNF